MPFDVASFDLCLCLQGLQFLPDRTAGLAELRRVLKPTGRLVASIWGPLEANAGHRAVVAALERQGVDATAAKRACSFADPEEIARRPAGRVQADRPPDRRRHVALRVDKHFSRRHDDRLAFHAPCGRAPARGGAIRLRQRRERRARALCQKRPARISDAHAHPRCAALRATGCLGRWRGCVSGSPPQGCKSQRSATRQACGTPQFRLGHTGDLTATNSDSAIPSGQLDFAVGVAERRNERDRRTHGRSVVTIVGSWIDERSWRRSPSSSTASR